MFLGILFPFLDYRIIAERACEFITNDDLDRLTIQRPVAEAGWRCWPSAEGASSTARTRRIRNVWREQPHVKANGPGYTRIYTLWTLRLNLQARVTSPPRTKIANFFSVFSPKLSFLYKSIYILEQIIKSKKKVVKSIKECDKETKRKCWKKCQEKVYKRNYATAARIGASEKLFGQAAGATHKENNTRATQGLVRAEKGCKVFSPSDSITGWLMFLPIIVAYLREKQRENNNFRQTAYHKLCITIACVCACLSV